LVQEEDFEDFLINECLVKLAKKREKWKFLKIVHDAMRCLW